MAPMESDEDFKVIDTSVARKAAESMLSRESVLPAARVDDILGKVSSEVKGEGAIAEKVQQEIRGLIADETIHKYSLEHNKALYTTGQDREKIRDEIAVDSTLKTEGEIIQATRRQMVASETIERFQLGYTRNLQMTSDEKREVRDRISADPTYQTEKDVANAAQQAAAEKFLPKQELALWRMTHPKAVYIEPMKVVGVFKPAKASGAPEKRQAITLELETKDGGKIQLETSLSTKEQFALGSENGFSEVKEILGKVASENRPMKVTENGKEVKAPVKTLEAYAERDFASILMMPSESAGQLERMTFTLKGRKGERIEVDASLTASEAELLRLAAERNDMAPVLQILNNIYAEDRIAEMRENGKRVKMNPKQFTKYLSQEYEQVALNKELGTEPRVVEPSESLERKTAIAMVFQLGASTMVEAEGGPVKANRFVLTFEPTNEELAEFQGGASAFREQLARTFRDEKARMAFLDEHKQDASVYIPTEGLMTVSARQKHPDGVMLSAAEQANYIKHGVFGTTFDSFGPGYANGFEILQGARLAMLDVKPKELTDAMSILQEHHEPENDIPKSSFRLDITSEKRVDAGIEFMTGDHKVVTVEAVLSESQWAKVEEAARRKSKELLDLLEQAQRDNNLLRIAENGTQLQRKDFEGALEEYGKEGVSSSVGMKRPYEIQLESEGKTYSIRAMLSDDEQKRVEAAIHSGEPGEMQATFFWWRQTGAVSHIKVGEEYQDIDATIKHYMNADFRVVSINAEA